MYFRAGPQGPTYRAIVNLGLDRYFKTEKEGRGTPAGLCLLATWQICGGAFLPLFIQLNLASKLWNSKQLLAAGLAA